ncbi:unnamed protein product [Linum tenue]|uniref:Uncharacterized protein n=1 Tax=Linum tenue TaxID=586396 RepID=A0AAV0GRD6_9ROSI|nr:unnamed protein product [Linum tenue]
MHIAIIMSSSSSPLSLDPSAVAVKAAARKATGGVVDRVSPATFPSTVWGHGFLDKVDLSLQAKQKHPKYEVLKEEVRKMVKYEAESGNDEAMIADKLRVIDAIQRLGIGYHFETEIEEALEKVHELGEDSTFINIDEEGTDLYHKALRFRLLRQQGFRVSQDGFGKLKNSEGKFKEWLVRDEQGLLSLYEAAHIAFNGEEKLDEALDFTTKTLKSMLQHDKINPSSHKQIDFALRIPAWKCVPRSLARHSIDNFYFEDSVQNQKLLKFAKLDFNMVQKIHQEELYELSEWWNCLDVPSNFPYARDRLVECYYWLICMYFEPKYRFARIIATKILAVLSILDDTYDNLATYEEARTLTEAIERMDVCALQGLPDRMKNIYDVLFILYDEIEREIEKIGPTFAMDYNREELKKFSRAYLGEVRWRTEGRVPTLEEYMTEGFVTSGMAIVTACAFIGMGAEIANREAFEWLAMDSKMMRAGSVIVRLQNDILSHKFEQERSHAPSSVECYMKEYGVSEEEAVECLWKMISNNWKDIAEVYQRPTPLPVVLLDRFLHLTRSVNLFYDADDRYTNSHLLKDHLASLFINPVPL